jgi:hypothetical protein
MVKPDDVRTASHLVAHVSKMLRSEREPSPQEWAYLKSLFSGDAAFQVSNNLADLANSMVAGKAA